MITYELTRGTGTDRPEVKSLKGLHLPRRRRLIRGVLTIPPEHHSRLQSQMTLLLVHLLTYNVTGSLVWVTLRVLDG